MRARRTARTYAGAHDLQLAAQRCSQPPHPVTAIYALGVAVPEAQERRELELAAGSHRCDAGVFESGNAPAAQRALRDHRAIGSVQELHQDESLKFS
jgi:hypothetical protein